MNVPVITCPGKTFQSRVAASLLNNMGLEELIAKDLNAYEEMAISLAKDSQALEQLKQKMKKNRNDYPLFDTKRFVCNLEKAYKQMWKNYVHHQPSIILVKD